MRDRIPTKVLDNGAVRYAVYDENGAFLRYDYMLPADEPADEGTPLSKETLLSDDTETAIFGYAADRTVNQAIAGAYAAAAKLKLVAKYTTAGAYEWICPEGGEYIAVIIGGGGSGYLEVGISASGNIGGGASGYLNFVDQQITKGAVKNIVVGAGGAGYSITAKGKRAGQAGGSSSFDGVIAEGGEGGGISESEGSTRLYPAAGGQYSAGYMNKTSHPCFGGVPVFYRLGDTSAAAIYPPAFVPDFVDERGLPITMMCAGGSTGYNLGQTKDVPLPNGKTLSPALYINDRAVNLHSRTPTDCGAGSGAVKGYTTNSSGFTSVSASVGNGADGGVFIYKFQGGANA